MANIQSLSFSEALKSSTSKIFVFSGRARRSEFWWSMMTVYIICATIPALGLIGSVVSIPITFRRLHDTGRSGWWCGAVLILLFSLFWDVRLYTNCYTLVLVGLTPFL